MDLIDRLRRAGCVAAEDEARELLALASDDLDALVARRLAGEPLAWIVGRTTFAGIDLFVHPGVYVPRWQTEVVARRAAALLPADGAAVDLCTGTGAVAAHLFRARPAATVIATDIDAAAVANARANGVDALAGDLFEPLPPDLLGRVDVVVAVTPYVPSGAVSLLAATPEPVAALDGGPAGLDVVTRVVAEVPRWLRAGGALLLEVGAPQVRDVERLASSAGFGPVAVLRDPDGDVCGVELRFP